MGVYIKGMEMPNCCMFCPFSNSSGCGLMNPPVLMTSKEMLADRPDWCPLVSVPPHGDLIERNALFKKCEFVCTDDDVDVRAVRYSIIENAPTVIPAEEGET